MTQPVNTSKVAFPKWTGKAGEAAIVVGRGEPRRSNLQMEQAVAQQVEMYLLHHGPRRRPRPVVNALTVQLIAADHITPVGSQAVTLNREDLLAYVKVASAKLSEAAKGECDAQA